MEYGNRRWGLNCTEVGECLRCFSGCSRVIGDMVEACRGLLLPVVCIILHRVCIWRVENTHVDDLGGNGLQISPEYMIEPGEIDEGNIASANSMRMEFLRR